MIRQLKPGEDLPWELLLDADPQRSLVEDYLKRSELLVYEAASQVVGVIVFQAGAAEWEIMNVAVDPKWQGQGLGGELLDAALATIEKTPGAKEVIIKTGDLTSAALTLYQKKGFRQVALVKDYFIEQYDEPIYENGQRLRNQVILKRSAYGSS